MSMSTSSRVKLHIPKIAITKKLHNFTKIVKKFVNLFIRSTTVSLMITCQFFTEQI